MELATAPARKTRRITRGRQTTLTLAIGEDREMTRLVNAYIAAHCRAGTLVTVRDMYASDFVRISTECGA